MNLKDNEVVLVKIYTSAGVDTVSFDDYQEALDVIYDMKYPPYDSDFLLVGNVYVKYKEIVKVVVDKGEKMIEATFVLGSGENRSRNKLYFKTEDEMSKFASALQESGAVGYFESYKNSHFKVIQ